MKNKIFTFIHGETVHIAPKQKVIKEQDYSVTVEAIEVLKKVKEDAEKYKIEVATECEKLKEQAQHEGFEEGFKKWVEHIAKLEAEIQKVREDVSKTVVPVALKAAKKIVAHELEASPDTVVDIVANCLKAVAQHKRVIIYVSKKDYEIVEKNKNRIKDLFENLESLSIRARNDVEPGGCVIETEGGIINAQLENQWMVLERAFESMKKQQEKTSK